MVHGASRLRKWALASAAVGALILAVDAQAQTQVTGGGTGVAENAAGDDATAGDNTIVVTGSRIRRNPLDQSAPLTAIDSADIARTGLSSIGDVLQRLPGAAGGLNSRFNRSGNNGNPPDGGGVGAGSAEIDLRYLGSRRTLVLVDGLRFINGSAASGIPGAVDLNAIPDSMIERVDVLRDGASTIYGSDAIAGVVNIITKKRQNGFLATAQLGGYDKGDGVTQNYQLSWGHRTADDRVSVVVGANYINQGSVFAGDRPYYAFPDPGATACTTTCSSGTPNGRFIINNPVTGESMNRREQRFQGLHRRRPVQLPPVQLSADPAGALRRLRQLHRPAGGQCPAQHPADLQSPHFGQSGRAAAAVRRAGCGQRQSARHHLDRPDQSVQPVRRDVERGQ